MSQQKPGRSKQDYETPSDFINAVVRRFGPFDVDLAATKANAKAPVWIGQEQDSLLTPWTFHAYNAWLNPPFSHIEPWAKKCCDWTTPGRRILFLTPASVGANWFRDYVYDKALVLFLNGRLTFVGETAPYPKDCILSLYGEKPGFEVWNWRQGVRDCLGPR